jgi:hypothetical protein
MVVSNLMKNAIISLYFRLKERDRMEKRRHEKAPNAEGNVWPLQCSSKQDNLEPEAKNQISILLPLV